MQDRVRTCCSWKSFLGASGSRRALLDDITFLVQSLSTSALKLSSPLIRLQIQRKFRKCDQQRFLVASGHNVCTNPIWYLVREQSTFSLCQYVVLVHGATLKLYLPSFLLSNNKQISFNVSRPIMLVSSWTLLWIGLPLISFHQCDDHKSISEFLLANSDQMA